MVNHTVNRLFPAFELCAFSVQRTIVCSSRYNLCAGANVSHKMSSRYGGLYVVGFKTLPLEL